MTINDASVQTKRIITLSLQFESVCAVHLIIKQAGCGQVLSASRQLRDRKHQMKIFSVIQRNGISIMCLSVLYPVN